MAFATAVVQDGVAACLAGARAGVDVVGCFSPSGGADRTGVVMVLFAWVPVCVSMVTMLL